MNNLQVIVLPVSVGTTSVALRALGESYWHHQHVATLLQISRLYHYNHTSNSSTHCQAGGLRLSPVGGSQSRDTNPLPVSPFPFPPLGNFTAHLHPGHGSDPSPCYSSFMHYNTPDWSQEPHHIVPARFTHGCMLLSVPLQGFHGDTQNVWRNLLPTASDPPQVLTMAKDWEVKAGVSTGQTGSIWEEPRCFLSSVSLQKTA